MTSVGPGRSIHCTCRVSIAGSVDEDDAEVGLRVDLHLAHDVAREGRPARMASAAVPVSLRTSTLTAWPSAARPAASAGAPGRHAYRPAGLDGWRRNARRRRRWR